MIKELELFSLDGLGGWFKRTKGHEFVPEPGQTCKNCETVLEGRFCHVCGQNADTHHRTIGHLIFEAFEGLFHLDGRIWQTLPPLFFNPGRLARDLMEGRVTRHLPPFRIFLVALLVFMFTAEHKTEEMRHEAEAHPQRHTLQDAVKSIEAEANAESAAASIQTDDPHVTIKETKNPDGTIDRTITRNVSPFALSEADAHYLAEEVKASNMQPASLKADIVKALENPEGFMHALFAWGHRLALLLLPIMGLSLGLLYIGKKHRRYFLYDHLLISMNLLSFMFFTLAIGFALPEALSRPGRGILMCWILVNFYQTLRGAYGSSIPGAVLKSLALWTMTMLSFSILLVGVIFVSLTAG